MAHSQHPNHLLASLHAADFALLQPQLNAIELTHETVLFQTGAALERVYFPHSGVISLVVPLEGGQMIEAAMIGRDSIVGGTSALDSKVALSTAIVQVPGTGSTLAVNHFRKVADESVAFRTTLIRHEQVLFAQAQQSAACNVSHTVEARLCRWLLRTRDLSGGDSI